MFTFLIVTVESQMFKFGLVGMNQVCCYYVCVCVEELLEP